MELYDDKDKASLGIPESSLLLYEVKVAMVCVLTGNTVDIRNHIDIYRCAYIYEDPAFAPPVNRPRSCEKKNLFTSGVTNTLFIMASKEKNAKFITHAKTLKNIPWCDDYEKMISGMVFVHVPTPTLRLSTNKVRIDMIHLFPNYEQVGYGHVNLSRNTTSIYQMMRPTSPWQKAGMSY